MNRIERNAKDVYYAGGDINVNNFFQEKISHIPWIHAFAQITECSVIFFDKDLKVIYMNNAWGTFSKRPKSATEIFCKVNDMYFNPGILQLMLIEVKQFCQKRESILRMVNGVDVFCRGVPVLDNGNFTGMILSAWKK